MNARAFRTLRWLISFLPFLAGTLPAGAAAKPTHPEPFQDGDRWAVIGDGVTHHGTYQQWINLFYLTRFPDRTIDVYNCGIAGDRAGGAVRRLDWDVLSHQPTVATVMFGMSDVDRSLYGDAPATPSIATQRQAALNAYRVNLRALVEKLQGAGVRVILLTPTIFDQTADLAAPKQTGINEALGECAAFTQELAGETGAAFVDFYDPMMRITHSRQARDPGFTLIGPDRIHPGEPGSFLMAYLFLMAQVGPQDVSRIAVDVKAGRVVEAYNGVMENIVRQADGITFTWTARALPFPVDSAIEPALAWVPFISDLNREMLQVAGLAPGTYELRIDEVPIRQYSADDLAKGVNLSIELRTPEYDQARSVLRLLRAETALVADNLRTVAQVEHQSAPDLAHPVTLEQMQPYLLKRLQVFRENPPDPAVRRPVDLYADLKGREEESRASARRMIQLARLAVQPQPRAYSIRLVK